MLRTVPVGMTCLQSSDEQDGAREQDDFIVQRSRGKHCVSEWMGRQLVLSSEKYGQQKRGAEAPLRAVERSAD
jgi:hypothetical protein